jgi:hypothetical protein
LAYPVDAGAPVRAPATVLRTPRRATIVRGQVAKQRCRIYEVGVSYYGRTYAEGKKIGVKDGFRALYAIAKHNFFG